MSQDALAKLIEAANADPRLKKELSGQTLDAVVAIAAKHGYEITQEESMAAAFLANDQPEGELDDASLKAVAGGAARIRRR